MGTEKKLSLTHSAYALQLTVEDAYRNSSV